MRHRGIALTALAVALVAACSSPTPPPEPTDATTSSPSSSAGTTGVVITPDVPDGQVVVTISGLTGAAGGTVAGIVFDGPTAEDGVGGFAVRVRSDPFPTERTVTAPRTTLDTGLVQGGLFPYVTSTPLVLESGAYHLELWAAPGGLGMYARWVPSDAEGMVGCRVYFTVERPMGTRVTVADLPSWPGHQQGCSF